MEEKYLMSDSPGDGWQDWKNQSWATLKAKREEKELPLFLEPPNVQQHELEWQRYSRFYTSNPKAFESLVEQQSSTYREQTVSALKRGDVVKAANYGDAAVVEMQKTMEQMARANGFEKCPELIIHTENSQLPAAAHGMRAMNSFLPEYVETNNETIKYLIAHPGVFKATIAHELGHQANRDTSNDNRVKQLTTPPNRKLETLADRMGAIIHGNPKEYAKFKSEWDFSSKPKSQHSIHSKEYSSPNGIARMLYKWADILEDKGAVDKETGEITHQEIALEVFDHSKEWAEIPTKPPRRR